MNDVDHNWGSTPPMNYGNDDDPIAKPTPAPCQATANAATQANGVAGAPVHIHVKPNAHDEPTQAYVELWGAVTSSNPAGTIVYWDVYHPNGSFKVQVDGTRYASSANAANCAGPAGMFAAALTTGQVTQAAVTNMQNECKFQQKSFWYGAFGISKHQPYGTYKIDLHAANAGGSETVLTYYIQVHPFYQLEKDFTTVAYGGVTANSHFWQLVQGDFAWQGVNNPGNGATSVRNTGNAGIGLDVRFSSMCRQESASCTDDKRIDHFDVKYGKVISGLESMGDTSLANALLSDTTSANQNNKPAPPGPWYSFNDQNQAPNDPQVLCPNDVAKIEFSIWTENIQAGTYSAPNGIGLRARPLGASSGCATDLGGPYNAGQTPTSNTHAGPPAPAV